MRVSVYAELLDKLLDQSCKLRQPLMVKGYPGIGKSEVPVTVGERKGYRVGVLNCPILDVPFLQGYPAIDKATGRADHSPFGILYDALHSTEPFLLVLEEFASSVTSVQKAALRFMQQREVCGKRLPDHVRVIANGNDTSHHCDVQGMIESMKGRFLAIVEVEAHIEDTVRYGLANGWPNWLVAYLHNHPEELIDFQPSKSLAVTSCDPRSWDYVGQQDNAGLLDNGWASELVCGRVGAGHGAKALAARKLYGQLPDVDQCLLAPEDTVVPDDPGARYMVSIALAARLDGNTFGQGLKYLQRLPHIFRLFSLRAGIKREGDQARDKKVPAGYRNIHTSRDWIAYANSEEGRLVLSTD